MKRMKLWTSLALSGAMIFGMTSYALADNSKPNNQGKQAEQQARQSISFEFDDTQEAVWAQDYIGKMQALDVIKGYTDGTFKPNKPVTQIEAITMAVRLMGLEAEAQARSGDVKLHFKDERSIPSWARGYVAVALENGLFDGEDDKVQPDKAATRVWIVELLVKALGMEEEALEQMSDIPDFKDVSSIPAGAIGYVNAAVKLGITTGYPDQTFGPNKPVTRGEMAAFLYRTNEERLDHIGTVIVQGQIRSVNFDKSVTDDVYVDGIGGITIQTYDGQLMVFRIDADLLVEDDGRFITADQLAVGDVITLIAQDGTVVDAVLVVEQDEEGVNRQPLVDFEVELEADDQELKLKYKNKNGKAQAEYELKQDGRKVRLTGEEALQAVEAYMAKAALEPSMSDDAIVRAVLAAMPSDVSYEELEIEIRFANGKKVKIELEQDERDAKSKADHTETAGAPDTEGASDLPQARQIVAFKVELELDDDVEAKWHYQLKKNGKPEAEIEIESESGKGKAKIKDKLKGQQAVDHMEVILSQLVLTKDMAREDMIEAVLAALNIDKQDIEELEIEIKYANGDKLKVDSEDQDDDHDDDEDDEEDDD